MNTLKSKWTLIVAECKEPEKMSKESVRNLTYQPRHGFPSNDVYNHINHTISFNLKILNSKLSALKFVCKNDS